MTRVTAMLGNSGRRLRRFGSAAVTADRPAVGAG